MIEAEGLVRDENFRPIDGNLFLNICTYSIYISLVLAIVLLGEPINWESALQVITDLLLTDGNPAVLLPDRSDNREHIPVIACNRDLVFKAAADLPRFGHGAFLTCLEALHKVIFIRGISLYFLSVYRISVGKN